MENETMKPTYTADIDESDPVTITNRAYRDGVFTTLFGDKNKICELYNALHDTDRYKETDIEIHTLQKAIF